MSGVVLGILVGIGYWLTSPEVAYQLISAIILGWSVSYCLDTTCDFWIRTYWENSRNLFIFSRSHHVRYDPYRLYSLLHETVETGIQPPVSAVLLFLFILLIGSADWFNGLARNRTSRAFTILYLWLVRLGEPHHDVVESHPKYLTQSMSQGGNE